MSNPRACQPLKVKALAPVVRDLTPEYEGPYTVEPSSQSSVVIPVQGKKMTQDLTVERATLEELNVSITENGERRIEAEEGYLGLSGVNLTTNVQPPLQSKSVEYNANGSYEVTTDSNYYGLEKVNVRVSTDAEYPENDVEFIDFDGRIVHSYTKEEFLALTEMPEHPTHSDLISDGWNWDLSDAKAYVTNHGMLVIGACYLTENGKTQIHFTLPDLLIAPYLCICVNGTAHVEWGDGTSEDITGNSLTDPIYTQHIYSSVGNYIIKITPPDGNEITMATYVKYQRSCFLTSSAEGDYIRAYYPCKTWITRIDVGKNISINQYSFCEHFCLDSICLTNSNATYDAYFLKYAYSLKALVSPYKNNLMTTENFSDHTSYNIKRISLSGGNGALFNNMNSVYQSCYALKKMTIPDEFSRMSSASTPFGSCFSLEYISFPTNITTFGYGFFSGLYSLKKVEISSTVTTLPTSCFNSCYSLSELIIPDSITRMEAQALGNLQGLKVLKFERTTPPTAVQSSVFTQLNINCTIYVPQASLNAYKTATNYPDPNTYTYVGY